MGCFGGEILKNPDAFTLKNHSDVEKENRIEHQTLGES